MHNEFPNKYYFINKFDTNYIDKQDKHTALIFRNYTNTIEKSLILKIQKYCKKRGNKFLLSNNIKLAIKLNLDGAYVPSFNKDFRHLSYSYKRNFIIIGSAHTLKEIKTKEQQKVQAIFLSSIFKNNKNYLGINRFKLLALLTQKKIVALGGISKTNIKRLNLIKCFGFAGISFFEQKKGP
tara:strand:+ start:2122 stop:2664 length:543 start_codon:yes stop_codon:yes gene_type:complete